MTSVIRDEVQAVRAGAETARDVAVAAVDGITGPEGPEGPQGLPGLDGADGATGATGPSVQTGGGTNALLAKNSETDYDTKWVPKATVRLGKMYLAAGRPILSIKTQHVDRS